MGAGTEACAYTSGGHECGQLSRLDHRLPDECRGFAAADGDPRAVWAYGGGDAGGGGRGGAVLVRGAPAGGGPRAWAAARAEAAHGAEAATEGGRGGMRQRRARLAGTVSVRGPDCRAWAGPDRARAADRLAGSVGALSVRPGAGGTGAWRVLGSHHSPGVQSLVHVLHRAEHAWWRAE